MFMLVATDLLASNNVSDTSTATDVRYENLFLSDAGYSNLIASPPATTFNGQIQVILDVQNAVLARAPGNRPLPFDRDREPKSIYKTRSGMCYDRSRVIEKIFRHLGYVVRHVAIYSTRTTGSKILSLLTPRVPSHSISEIRTLRGWMLVDPNDRWIGLTRRGKTVDAAELQDDPALADRAWDPRVSGKINEIFRAGFTYVFGLYSRHGQFYPPYMPIPDINWGEAMYNVTG
jgi:hypothetical protein